jgi:hypothetical protein
MPKLSSAHDAPIPDEFRNKIASLDVRQNTAYHACNVPLSLPITTGNTMRTVRVVNQSLLVTAVMMLMACGSMPDDTASDMCVDFSLVQHDLASPIGDIVINPTVDMTTTDMAPSCHPDVDGLSCTPCGFVGQLCCEHFTCIPDAMCVVKTMPDCVGVACQVGQCVPRPH